MKKIISGFIGDYSSREIKRIMPIVEKIKALDNEMGKIKDERLREITEELKERIKNGESLDDVLVEAFALVRKLLLEF